MPVTLEHLTDPDVRERAELAHLAAEQRDCPAYRAAWAAWLSGEPDIRLWAARFNDHIVGAALTEGDCIEGFAVRSLTRGRGVGTRMMQRLRAEGEWRVSAGMTPPTREFIHLWHGVPLRARSG